MNVTKRDVKRVLTHPIATHMYTLVMGGLLVWGMTNNAKQKREQLRVNR